MDDGEDMNTDDYELYNPRTMGLRHPQHPSAPVLSRPIHSRSHPLNRQQQQQKTRQKEVGKMCFTVF